MMYLLKAVFLQPIDLSLGKVLSDDEKLVKVYHLFLEITEKYDFYRKEYM